MSSEALCSGCIGPSYPKSKPELSGMSLIVTSSRFLKLRHIGVDESVCQQACQQCSQTELQTALQNAAALQALKEAGEKGKACTVDAFFGMLGLEPNLEHPLERSLDPSRDLECF